MHNGARRFDEYRLGVALGPCSPKHRSYFKLEATFDAQLRTARVGSTSKVTLEYPAQPIIANHGIFAALRTSFLAALTHVFV